MKDERHFYLGEQLRIPVEHEIVALLIKYNSTFGKGIESRTYGIGEGFVR